VVDMVNILPSR